MVRFYDTDVVKFNGVNRSSTWDGLLTSPVIQEKGTVRPRVASVLTPDNSNLPDSSLISSSEAAPGWKAAPLLALCLSPASSSSFLEGGDVHLCLSLYFPMNLICCSSVFSFYKILSERLAACKTLLRTQ